MRKRAREVCAAVFAACVLAAAGSLAPIQDETYYWAWSRALGVAYVDHPPAVAWVIAGARAVFGDGIAALRIATVAAMAVTAGCAVIGARRMGPRRAGAESVPDENPGKIPGSGKAEWLVVLLLAAAPMFSVGYLPATPDPFQGAMIAAASYFVIRALERDAHAADCFLAPFTLLTAILFKHSSGVLALGVFAGVLAGSSRRVLLRPATIFGVIAGLAAIAPWLLADHSVAFQTERVFSRGEHRGLLAIPVLAGGIAVALGPSGLVSFAALRSRIRDPATLALASGAIALLASCLVPVWTGGGELNWSMPAFVLALPAIAAALGDHPRLLRATRALAAISAIALAAILVHISRPYLPIAAAKDTTLRGAGFDALAIRAAALARAHDARAIVTRRYQPASELRFHLSDAIPVYELGGSRRSQYDAWPKPALSAGDEILIVTNTPELPPELTLTATETPELHERRARGQTLDTWYLRVARIAAPKDTRVSRGGSP